MSRMKPTRGDLVVIDDPWDPTEVERGTRSVTDADLAAMGLVQAPECGECFGDGHGPYDPVEDVRYMDERCPKCGGSGYGRLVSLDVDVQRLRHALVDWNEIAHSPVSAVRIKYLAEVARQVLAALDGEAT